MPPELFTAEIDNTDPFIEEPSFATTIWTAWSGVEQRRSQRSIPNLRFIYSVLTERARETGIFQSLVWGGQAKEWLVPYWPGTRRITADVSDTDTTILCEATAHGDFLVDRAVMLWESPYRAQAFRVTAVGATSVGITPAADALWRRRDGVVVVPLFLALLSPTVEGRLETFDAESANVTFDVKVMADLPYELPA